MQCCTQHLIAQQRLPVGVTLSGPGLIDALLMCTGHRKLVTAIALDPKGARLLTGSEDHQVQMYDFGGMKRDMRSFRSFEPSEGCPINAISFSPTGTGADKGRVTHCRHAAAVT